MLEKWGPKVRENLVDIKYNKKNDLVFGQTQHSVVHRERNQNLTVTKAQQEAVREIRRKVV